MDGPDFVSVRRPSDATFRVMPGDLVSDAAEGYDLDAMRRLIDGGPVRPISVLPLADGRFRVVGGGRRLAAIRMLVRINKQICDRLSGVARPAGKVFAMVRCRLRARPPSATARPDR